MGTPKITSPQADERLPQFLKVPLMLHMRPVGGFP